MDLTVMHPQGATQLMRKEVFLLGRHPGCSHFNVISFLPRRMNSYGGFHAVQHSLELPCPLTLPSAGRCNCDSSQLLESFNEGSKIIPISEILSWLVSVVLMFSITQQSLSKPGTDQFMNMHSATEVFITNCHPSCQLKQVKTLP